MEVTGFPPAVKDQILKLASINLCPNLSGQICCALMMNPPQPGEPSFDLVSEHWSAGTHTCMCACKHPATRHGMSWHGMVVPDARHCSRRKEGGAGGDDDKLHPLRLILR